MPIFTVSLPIAEVLTPPNKHSKSQLFADVRYAMKLATQIAIDTYHECMKRDSPKSEYDKDLMKGWCPVFELKGTWTLAITSLGNASGDT
jgi:hypothetical protein